MFKDAHEIPLKIGDTVIILEDGCLCIIRNFVIYEVVTEILLEDRLTHDFRTAQLRDVIKIA